MKKFSILLLLLLTSSAEDEIESGKFSGVNARVDPARTDVTGKSLESGA